MTDTQLPTFAFVASAAAAQVALLEMEPAGFWTLMAGAQVLILLSYAASSLPIWSGWIDGTLTQRLTILQSLLVALVAGNVAFFLSFEYGFSKLIALIAAAAGGYGGDKLLAPLMARIFGKVGPQS